MVHEKIRDEWEDAEGHTGDLSGYNTVDVSSFVDPMSVPSHVGSESVEMGHVASPRGLTRGSSWTVPDDAGEVSVVGATVSGNRYIAGLCVIFTFHTSDGQMSETVKCNGIVKSEFGPIEMEPGDEITVATNNPDSAEHHTKAVVHIEPNQTKTMKGDKNKMSKCPACGGRWDKKRKLPHECKHCDEFLPEIR